MTTSLSNTPPIGDWLESAPWRNRSVVLIHISDDGTVTQAHGLGEKRDMLCDLTGTLLVGWTGRYRTDIRGVYTDDDRDAVSIRVD